MTSAQEKEWFSESLGRMEFLLGLHVGLGIAALLAYALTGHGPYAWGVFVCCFLAAWFRYRIVRWRSERARMFAAVRKGVRRNE